jgi:hypothetical protein
LGKFEIFIVSLSKSKLSHNGPRMSRRLGFRFFNAHDFTKLTKETILPTFHKTPIFGYALLPDAELLQE